MRVFCYCPIFPPSPDLALTSETRARATAEAGTIRTDGAMAAATLLLDAIRRERPPVSA